MLDGRRCFMIYHLYAVIIYPCMSGHPYSSRSSRSSSSSQATTISPQPPRLASYCTSSTEITGFATVGVAQADTGNQSVRSRISYQTAMTDDCTVGTVHHIQRLFWAVASVCRYNNNCDHTAIVYFNMCSVLHVEVYGLSGRLRDTLHCDRDHTLSLVDQKQTRGQRKLPLHWPKSS